jgi:hypothetical protein
MIGRSAATCVDAAADGTEDMIRFGTLGPRRKYHLMRSLLSGLAEDMEDPMLCGACSGGLSRVILSAERRSLAEANGWNCSHCLCKETRARTRAVAP